MAKTDRMDKKVRIFSALEVANICGVVNQTTINWIKNGYLKAFTTPGGQYRIYAEDLKNFLDKRGMRIPKELNEITSAEDPQYILVVDDDVKLNDMVTRYLKKKLPAFTIDQAFDGFDAGAKFKELLPVLVILDIDLPGIDGHKLCRKIKEDSSYNNPFVIVVSGMSAPQEEAQILTEGADAFYAKPVDLKILVKAIQDLLG